MVFVTTLDEHAFVAHGTESGLFRVGSVRTKLRAPGCHRVQLKAALDGGASAITAEGGLTVVIGDVTGLTLRIVVGTGDAAQIYETLIELAANKSGWRF